MTEKKKSKTTKKKSKLAKKTTTSPGSKKKKRVALAYDDPHASRVAVTGSFCEWDEGIVLAKDRDGRWTATLTLPPGDYEYRFLVDGEWRDDPNCTERTPNRHGTENCILHV